LLILLFRVGARPRQLKRYVAPLIFEGTKLKKFRPR